MGRTISATSRVMEDQGANFGGRKIRRDASRPIRRALSTDNFPKPFLKSVFTSQALGCDRGS